MVLQAFSALVVLSVALLSSAQERCAVEIKSFEDVIRCVESRSPEVQRAVLQVERAKAATFAAGQWKNPEIGLDSFHGASDANSETEIAITFPLELGGKLSARKAVAESGVAKADAELFEARQKVIKETVLKLHRLRHLLHEQEIVEEAISTFEILVKQYARRPKLSPEQELTAAVFRMAKGEHDLTRAELLDELTTLETFFLVTAGVDSKNLKSKLPGSPKTWPKVAATSMNAQSARFKLLEADFRAAQADLALAKSESWPTINLGPSLKLQSSVGRMDQLYGFNVSLPMPLFHFGGGGRAAANAGVKLFEAQKNFGVFEETTTRAQLAKSYEQSIAILNSTLSHLEIEKRHGETERLFSRGIVPSSLVIEAHRTFVELEKKHNQRELKTIETLLAIQAIDGKNGELMR